MSALKRKIEKGFVAYLEAQAELTGVTVHAGADNSTAELPWLMVDAGSESRDSSLPIEAGVKLVGLKVEYQANANDSTRASLDTMLADLGCFLEDIDAIQTAINKQVDPDTRTLLGVHVYQVEMLNHNTEANDDLWSEEIELVVTCGEHDGF